MRRPSRTYTAAVMVWMSAAFFCLFAATGCGWRAAGTMEMESLPEEEPAIRAVWFSYLDWREFLPVEALSEEEFAAAADEVVQTCAAAGLNTVILQLRAFGDACYPSEVYPSVTENYDPLALFLTAAQRYGLSVWGWLNPFRLDRGRNAAAVGTSGARMISAADGVYWLDPADETAVKLICAGAAELAEYELSGIQIDDYFYSGVSPNEFGYGESQARQALSAFIGRLADVVHGMGMPFCISPQGNVSEQLIPASDEKLFTSLRLWCEGGKVDILMPQVYYGFAHETADFSSVMTRWKRLLAGTDCALAAGIAAYKCGAEDAYAGSGRMEWCVDSELVEKQASYALTNADGYALFRYADLV